MDHKQLFKLSKSLMGKQQETILPSSTSNKELSNAFSKFFINKVATIRDVLRELTTFNMEGTMDKDIPFIGEPLLSFRRTRNDEVRAIQGKAPIKACELDPVLTSILKKNLDAIVPFITNMINISFDQSEVPSLFKEALVRPLLKKSGLDKDVYKNYRPVSNLPFISKILEKVVATRLDEHLDNCLLRDPLQSVYRPQHSTETALLRVNLDIMEALDNQSSAVMVLLDLFASSDVIDHTILFQRLETSYDISGKSLAWIKSYFTNSNNVLSLDRKRQTSAIFSFVPHNNPSWDQDFTVFFRNQLEKFVVNTVSDILKIVCRI